MNIQEVEGCDSRESDSVIRGSDRRTLCISLHRAHRCVSGMGNCILYAEVGDS